ncbi:MAG: hydrogenase 4 subunit B, partial [Haemophilus parainfluenzae]|nr:hydrogenase 4 subunit B [Haemophilus parainfluenzae]
IQAVIKGATKAEPFWEEKMTMPIARFIPWLGTKIQWLQQGDFRVYCVYFVIALVAILLSIALM